MPEEWEYKTNDLGSYIQCPKCGHTISSVDVIFGNVSFTKCPNCNETLETSGEAMRNLYTSYEDFLVISKY